MQSMASTETRSLHIVVVCILVALASSRPPVAFATCDPSGVAWFSSEVSPSSARIEWRSPSPLVYSATVHRSDDGGPYTASGSASVDAQGVASFVDLAVAVGARYSYRLEVQVGACVETVGEVEMRIPQSPRLDFVNPAGSQRLVAVDVNHDDLEDLVMTDHTGHGLQVRLALPGGGFGAPQFTAIGRIPMTIQAADLDHDQNMDFVVGTLQGGLCIVLGNPDGTLGPVTEHDGGKAGFSYIAADFIQDGRPDLVYANNTGTYLAQGNGDGTFNVPRHIDTPSNLEPWIFGAGDFTSDGALDLVIGCYGKLTGLGVVLANTGAGTFQAPPVYLSIPADFYDLNVVDVDGDARADVVFPDNGWQTNAVWIYRSHGDGTFDPAMQLPVGENPRAIQWRDMNRDGRLDLLGSAGSFSDPRVFVVPNLGGLSFGSRFDAWSTTYVAGVTATDWNPNGARDLVATSEKGLSIYLDLYAATGDVPGERPRTIGLAVRGARPNPARAGNLALEVVLQERSAAKVDFLDVTGRRLGSIDLADPAPGERTIRPPSHLRFRPGLYLARVTQGERVASGRFVVVE